MARLSTLEQQAQALLQRLNHNVKEPPRLFDLFFFLKQDAITDPPHRRHPGGGTRKGVGDQGAPFLYKNPTPTPRTAPVRPTTSAGSSTRF